MRRIIPALITALAVSAFAILVSAQPVAARHAGKIPRIGFLSAASAKAQQPRFVAFQLGLKEVGYVVGRDIVIAARYADGQRKRLPVLSAELVALGVDVIVAQGAAARAAKKATATIPIVAIQSDPVRSGLVDSIARPGGNVTGLASQPPSLVAKRLQLLKEALPSVSRVAVLSSTVSTSHPEQMKILRAAAQPLGVTIIAVANRGYEHFDRAFSTIRTAKPNALVILAASLFRSRQARIIEFAAKNRLPAIYASSRWVEWGGLMSYGADLPELFRRAAHYVDKILRGAKPADLPVELPTKFYLAVNLKTAKALGIALPRPILLRANKVIE